MTPPDLARQAEAEPARIAARAPHRSNCGPRPDMLSASHYAAQRRRRSRLRIAAALLIVAAVAAVLVIGAALPLPVRIAAALLPLVYGAARAVYAQRRRAVESQA